jgi:hypothetical protein
MFFSPASAVIFCAIQLVFGALIGVAAAALAYRRRLRLPSAVRAAACAGLVFLLLAAISAWAGAHEAFYNGKRVSVGPSGESLWLRNEVTEHALLLCICSSAAVGLFAGRNNMKSARKNI